MAETPEDLTMHRLRQLIAEKCNDTLTPAGHDELEALLGSSADARAAYWDSLGLHANLTWELAGKENCGELLAQLAFEDVWRTELAVHRPSRAFVVWGPAIAACLLVGALVGGWSFWRIDAANQPIAVQPELTNSLDESPILGRLKPLVTDTRWSFGRPGERNPDAPRCGDTIWLDEGAAELRLTSNTVALLEAPIILQVVSVDRLRLLQGRIKVDVPRGAEGFTVETASAEVVDLGTSFSVDVANENTDVIVFQGEIDLNVIDQQVSSDQPAGTSTKRFRMGEAVRVNIDGTLSRIVKVQQTDFSQDGGSDDEPILSVITNVSDNINRDDLWSFYEIVPGGIGEDELCYVDRPYEWNGATSDGMPAYLAGGDYVKTFCNDKITEDLTIEVTLGRAATLYVLFDKRATPPAWLTRSFEATGDDIGIDETNFDVWKQEPKGPNELEVGPGKGIERRFSIWRKVVTEASTVSLGPNGVPAHVPESLDLNAEVVMYGIVAVPLERGI